MSLFSVDGQKDTGREASAAIKTVIDSFRRKYAVPSDLVLPPDTIRALSMVAHLKKTKPENLAMRPIKSNVPSNEEIANWRESFSKIYRNENEGHEVADLLLKHLQRIDQDTFERTLMKIFLQLEKKLKRFSKDEYAVINYGVKNKSNDWVLRLAGDYVSKNESLVLQADRVNYFLDKEKPKKKVGIIFDDASYSGYQIEGIMQCAVKDSKIQHFLIAVPFITNHAIVAIRNKAEQLGITVELLYEQIMPTLEEAIGDEKFNKLKRIAPEFRINEGQTLTYFAHKVPDERSICPYLANTRYVYVNFPDLIKKGGIDYKAE